MKWLYYVGKPYPHAQSLQVLTDRGYKFGIFRDKSQQGKINSAIDKSVDLDFSSRDNFIRSLRDTTDMPKVDGLLCTYENYITYKSILGEFLNVPTMSLDAAEKCTDKYLMRAAFRAQNPNITPDFVFLSSEQDALIFADKVGYPLILKPANLVKSLLISRCNDKTELVQVYRKTMARISDIYHQNGVYDRKPRLILERFIVGQMCSVAAFVDQHGQVHFCDGVCDLVSAQSAGFNDNFLYSRKLPADLTADLQQKIFAVARQGVQALGMKASPAHIEIIYNQDVVQLVEIGARIGGYRPMMYDLSYGIDMLSQEIKTALGEVPNPRGKLRGFSAVYEIFPSQAGTFQGLFGVESPKNYHYYNLAVEPGDIVGASQDGYKAPLRIAIVDPDLNKFQRRCTAVEKIRILTR